MSKIEYLERDERGQGGPAVDRSAEVAEIFAEETETEGFEGLPRGEWSTFKRTPRPLPQKKPAPRKKPAKLSPAALDRARARARQRRAALRAALTPEEKRLVRKVLREREDEVIRKMRERAKR